MIRQILLALNFMHSKNIMHRDLKPENILCEDCAGMQEDEIIIKLTDFGFATKFDPDGQEKHTLSLGSAMYMAPELCQEEEYDSKVDVWSIGVIAFVLLAGMPPFYDRTMKNDKLEIYADIIENEPDYSLLEHVSSYAVDFIKSALKKQASERASINELLQANWIVRRHTVRSSLNEADLNREELDLSANLVKFAKTTIF